MSELIDRQALLDECLNHYEVGNIEQNCTMDWICKTVRNFPAASPWHRVEEELPEIGKIVLVYDDWDRLSICQLDKQYRWLRQGGGWFDVPYVRYWMPIEPPKEDA